MFWVSLEYFKLHTILVNSPWQCGGRCFDTSEGGEHLIRIFIRQHFEHLKMAGIPHDASDNDVSDINEDHASYCWRTFMFPVQQDWQSRTCVRHRLMILRLKIRRNVCSTCVRMRTPHDFGGVKGRRSQLWTSTTGCVCFRRRALTCLCLSLGTCPIYLPSPLTVSMCHHYYTAFVEPSWKSTNWKRVLAVSVMPLSTWQTAWRQSTVVCQPSRPIVPLCQLCLSLLHLPLPLVSLTWINGMLLLLVPSIPPHWTDHSGLYWLLAPCRHLPRHLDNSLTFRNGRLSFDVHRRSRLNRESSLLPYSQLHVPVKPKASLEAAREVDFGRSSASVLQASLRLDLSPKSPVMTLSFIWILIYPETARESCFARD